MSKHRFSTGLTEISSRKVFHDGCAKRDIFSQQILNKNRLCLAHCALNRSFRYLICFVFNIGSLLTQRKNYYYRICISDTPLSKYPILTHFLLFRILNFLIVMYELSEEACIFRECFFFLVFFSCLQTF